MAEENTAHGDPCPDQEWVSPLEGRLEPEVRDHTAATSHALTSIAISLKRIADAVAPETGPTMLDDLQQTLTNGIQNGVGEAIFAWRQSR